MFRRSRRAAADVRTGWFADEFRLYDERYYRDGEPTDQVKSVVRDDSFDDGFRPVVVEGHATSMTRLHGHLVVRDRAGVEVSIPLGSCTAAEVFVVPTADGFTVLRFVLDVVFFSESPQPVRLVLHFPSDRADDVRGIADDVNSEGPLNAAPSARPDATHGTPTIDVQLGGRAASGDLGATAPRDAVRQAPDTADWVSFRPLAANDDVLSAFGNGGGS